MRQIIFRGKHIDNGEWVYGDVFHNYDGRVFVGEDEYELGNGFYEIIPETVGQYVGFEDKNGVKIFEGDILDNSRWIVSYSGNLNEGLGMNAGWYIQRDDFESWSELDCETYHVVLGNVWDNPELLERK